MILPGHIFLDIKKIRWNQQFHVGTVLLLIHVLIYLFFTLPESVFRTADNENLLTSRRFNLTSLQNMYTQATDTLTDMQQLDLNDFSFLKDKLFWQRAQTFPFTGDQIEIEKNKHILLNLQNSYFHSSQYRFGLGHDATSPWAWLTYQFTHAGIFHLLSNMIFLILIVNILMCRVDQNWILSVFVLGGIGAGVSYLLFSTNNETSMVGASGSLCALIAFLSTIENKKNIQWSYFLSPLKGGYGIIYLPAYLLFPIYLLTDFTTTLYQANGISQSVAHSAHIGGALVGFLLGALYLIDQKIKLKIKLKISAMIVG